MFWKTWAYFDDKTIPAKSSCVSPDDVGNVVAGESVVAADAEGDLAAAADVAAGTTDDGS